MSDKIPRPNVFSVFNYKKKKDGCNSIETTVTLDQSEVKEVKVHKFQIKSNIGNISDLGDIESGPKQPILMAYPKTLIGTQKRGFSSSCYNDNAWLEYSCHLDAAFYYCCRLFASGSGNQEDTWTVTGFCNWKKLTDKIKSHSSTTIHLTCMSRMNSYKSSKVSGSVMCQISTAQNDQKQKNEEYIKTLIDITLFLAKQGIAFRGHLEDKESNNQGNFKEACKLVAKCNSNFDSLYSKKISHTSWIVQNELIDICAEHIKTTIINEVKSTGIVAIMVDEARSYKEEQLSICIRYVNGLDVCERFLTFIDVSSSQKAIDIVAAILMFLEQSNMKDVKVIAQSYDGASVMSGQHGGVQTLMKEHYPYVIYIHCVAHRLNLIVVDTYTNIINARNMFNVLESIYTHFSHPKKNKMLHEFQINLGLSQRSISKICDTRWICRYKTCNAIKTNFKAIVKALQFEINETSDKDVTQAIGILSSIEKASFKKTETLGNAANLIN
eukprot:XP_016657066.1 PREDICTED: zinc finger MYM-type protein 1-like [Acyrthosiphon pisum]